MADELHTVKRRRAGWGEARKFLAEKVLPYSGAECLFWPFMRNNNGYALIGGRTASEGPFVVSREVCLAIHGPPPTPKHEAAHSCGNGHLGCVTPAHVSWKTHAENMDDQWEHGTIPIGEKNPRAKLTENQVREIRAKKGVVTQQALASEYAVSRSLIKAIHRRARWGWLP